MTTPSDYRAFSSDCVRWSESAKDASQRQILTDLAGLWENAAKSMEHHITLGADKTALFKELRSKLD